MPEIIIQALNGLQKDLLYIYGPDGPRGANGAPNWFSRHPNSYHIGCRGSRTNGMAVAAQNTTAQFRRESLKQPIYSYIGP